MPPTIDEELSGMERDIRQLKIEYDQFFGGGRKRPPTEIEWRIEQVIKRHGERYLLVNNGAPAADTLVNEVPVADSRDLQDGDRIQLGNILLRFHLRAAQSRGRPSRDAAMRVEDRRTVSQSIRAKESPWSP